MKRLLTCLSCTLLFVSGTRAQSVGPSLLNATGGSQIIGGNTYEYAIGDGIAGNTYIAAGLVVTPGILQPAAATTGITNPAIAVSDLSVYPNPVEHNLFLQPHFGKKGTLNYVLYDASGRTIAVRQIILEQGNEKQEIRMGAYAAGQYTLSVQWLERGTTYQAAYKIQKIN